MKPRHHHTHADYAEIGHGPALFVIHAGADNNELLESTFQPLAAAGFRVVVTNLQQGDEGALADDLDAATRGADDAERNLKELLRPARPGDAAPPRTVSGRLHPALAAAGCRAPRS